MSLHFLTSKYFLISVLLISVVGVGIYFSPRILQNFKSDIVAAPHVTRPPTPLEIATGRYNQEQARLERESLEISKEWEDATKKYLEKEAQIRTKYYDGTNGDIARQQKLIDIANQELTTLRSWLPTQLDGNALKNEIEEKDQTIKNMEKTKESYIKEYESALENELKILSAKEKEHRDKNEENLSSQMKNVLTWANSRKGEISPGLQTGILAPGTEQQSAAAGMTPQGQLTPETERKSSVMDLQQIGKSAL